MIRWLKWTAGVLAVLVLLLAAGAVAVRLFFSSDQVRRLAEAQAHEYLGRKVRLERLSIGLFSTEAAGLTIEGGPEGGGQGPPLLQAAEIRVLLNPTALLYKRVSLLSVTLSGVSVHASRDARGRFSFQDILDRLEGPSQKRAARAGGPLRALSHLAAPPAEAAPEKGEGAGPGFEVVIRSLEMQDVKLSFAAEATERTPAFRAMCVFREVEARGIREGAPFDLEADGSCTEPGLIRFKGRLYADARGSFYRLAGEAQPFEVAPFVRLAPAVEGVRALGGRVGGRASVSFSGGRELQWETDLQGEGVAAEIQADPQKPWRNVRLERVAVRSQGGFDIQKESARLARLEVDLPFGKGRLTKPSRWNVSGQDEVHADLSLSDLGAAARWAGSFLDAPLGRLDRGGKFRLELAASRDRKKAEGWAFRSSAEFDPLDLAPLAALAPPQEAVRALAGSVEGRAELAFSAEKVARWKVDLRAEGLAGQIRPNPQEDWRPLRLAGARVRSEGSFDVARESAEVARLEVDLPFAQARLVEGGRWNVSGRDEAKLNVSVSDLAAALALAREAAGLPLKEIPKGGKVELLVSASRSRGREPAVSFAASAALDGLEVAPLARLAELPETVRALGGRTGGKLDVSFSPGRRVEWRTDLKVQGLSAEVRPEPKGPWRKVRLASAGLRSEGWYEPQNQSAGVAQLEIEVPFGKVSLRKPAKWNVSGRDEIDVLVGIDDLSAAEQWAGSIVELPIKPGKKGEKLGASLAATRDRRQGKDFSYVLSASFDPLELGPLARLLALPPLLREVEGEVAGKIQASYTAAKLARWEADLRGEGLSAEVRPDPKGRWAKLPLGRLTLRSEGSYDFLLGSAEVARLEAELPFGKVQVPKKSLWNHSGRDEIHLAWNISNLAAAASAAGAAAGGPLSRLRPEGTAQGALALVRDRRSAKALSAAGSAEANLQRLHFLDHPKLEIRGGGRVQFDGGAASLSVPQFAVHDRSRPQEPPAALIEGFTASLSQPDLMGGRIASKQALAKRLILRISADPENRSTLDSLLESAPPARPSPGDGAKAPAASKKAPSGPGGGAPSPSAKKPAARPSRGQPLPPERPADHLPDMRVDRIEIAQVDFHFRHEVEKGKPPAVIERKDLHLLVENFDTRMRPGRLDARARLAAPGEAPPLLLEANLNPGVTPVAVAGTLTLRKYDLRPLSPYARRARGAEIEQGVLDLDARFSLKREYLQAEAKGKVVNLQLRSVGKRNFLTKAQEVAEGVALDLLRRRRGEIPISVRVQGRLDDPSTSIYGMAVDSILVGVFEKLLELGGRTRELGGNVTDILRGVIEGAIGGRGAAPEPPQAQPSPEGQAQPPTEKPSAKDLGKTIEKELKKGLKELLGR